MGCGEQHLGVLSGREEETHVPVSLAASSDKYHVPEMSMQGCLACSEQCGRGWLWGDWMLGSTAAFPGGPAGGGQGLVGTCPLFQARPPPPMPLHPLLSLPAKALPSWSLVGCCQA